MLLKAKFLWLFNELRFYDLLFADAGQGEVGAERKQQSQRDKADISRRKATVDLCGGFLRSGVWCVVAVGKLFMDMCQLLGNGIFAVSGLYCVPSRSLTVTSKISASQISGAALGTEYPFSHLDRI